MLISFEEALKNADTNKHLLLGNGFSIDWRNNIFQYDALFDQADFTSLNIDANLLFTTLNTTNFEVVIEGLRKASKLSSLYSSSDSTLSKKFSEDAEKLKEILAKTIAKNHPEHPNKIKKSEYQHCRRFLSNFNSFYTLNYDLLLYWSFMHDDDGMQIKSDDGFRNSDDDSAEYVVWDNGKSHNQKIHYLHGALHLFDAGTELQKFTWNKTGIKLLDQIRSALDSNMFPHIVAEGTSDEKLTIINHSGYLHKAKRSFSEISGSLFIHGHSLADNDNHIIMLIPETNINKLFISFTSDPQLPANYNKMLKIQILKDKRKEIVDKIKNNKKLKKQELEVYCYQASTAQVWR